LAAGFLDLGSEGKEGQTELHKVASFSAAEAKAFLLAAVMFFRSKFGNFDGINIHCIRVMD